MEATDTQQFSSSPTTSHSRVSTLEYHRKPLKLGEEKVEKFLGSTIGLVISLQGRKIEQVISTVFLTSTNGIMLSWGGYSYL